jgi:acyl carrier protein
MNESEIYAKLQSIFDSVFMSPVVLTPELTAKDVEEWDSLIHVSLVLAVEDGFGIRFRVGEVEDAKNVGDLVLLIQKRVGGK